MIVMTTSDTQTMSTLTPARPASARVRSTLDTVWRDFVYLLGAFTMSIVGFIVWVTGLSVTVSLLVLIVGAFVWVGTVYVFRWTTLVDRRLAGWLRRDPISAVYRRPTQPGFLDLLKTVTTDPQTWKEVGWLVGNSIAGFAITLIALTVTALVLAWITLPIWWWAIPNPHTQYATLNFGIYTVTSLGWAFVTMALGLVMLPVALLLNRAVATRAMRRSPRASSVRASASNCSPGSASSRARARTWSPRRTSSSGESSVTCTTELRPGSSRSRWSSGWPRRNSPKIPTRPGLPSAGHATRRLVRSASCAISRAAYARRCCRSVGSQTAIEDLAHRSAIPATTELTGGVDSLPAEVATAVYFVAAEALTNAAKHSHATTIRLAVNRHEHDVTVTVLDNGRGGANPAGSGLDGLRARVRALDGRFEVQSPVGGPTLVRAELPCE